MLAAVFFVKKIRSCLPAVSCFAPVQQFCRRTNHFFYGAVEAVIKMRMENVSSDPAALMHAARAVIYEQRTKANLQQKSWPHSPVVPATL